MDLQRQNQYAPQSLVPGSHMAVPDYYRQGASPYPYYGPQEQLESEQAKFDVFRYLRALVKHRLLITVIVLTAVLLAIAFTFLETPIYRSTVSVQIDRESINITNVQGLQNEEALGSLDFYQTQYELLASRTLAERVATTLGLASDAKFNLKNKGLIGTVKDLVLGTSKNETANDLSQDDIYRSSVDRLQRVITIAPVRGTRIVKISADHSDPGTAQKLANGFAEVYIADNLDRRFDATSYARKFLEDRLAQLKARLEESEKSLVKYAEEQGIIRLDDNKNLSSADLEAVNTKLAAARAERIKKELLWEQAKQANGLGLKEILDSDAVKANRKLRAELAATYQQKLAVFKPAFPEMVQLRNQIKELDRQIQAEIASIKSAIEAQYLAAKSEEEQFEAQLQSVKDDVVVQRNRSIQYNILQREVDTNRSLYDGLLQRYKEIGVAGGVGTNNIFIVDKAALPLFPRTPNLLLNIALGLFLGLAIAFAVAIILDFLDDSFKSPEDVEQATGLPVVGLIPLPKPGMTVENELGDERSGMAEAYRSLRTGLQFATSHGLPRTLLITSSQPSEGKTTTTITLSRSLASIGMNVLLIDGDLRNASVHKRGRWSNSVGLSNYLSGAMQPEEVAQNTETDNLMVITSGPLPPNPAELLNGPRMGALLALAAESFDIVLVDGPPVMGLADAPLLSAATQSTMLVIAANETRRATVKVALRRLRLARANMVGALLNKFDSKEVGYGYGYGYGDYDYHSYGQDVPKLPGAG